MTMSEASSLSQNPQDSTSLSARQGSHSTAVFVDGNTLLLLISDVTNSFIPGVSLPKFPTGGSGLSAVET